MPKRHWLIKSEPAAYSWDDLRRDGETLWDGIRNHRAASNLRTMEKGDQAFFYHSVTGKEIVGIAEISEAGLADPKDGSWAAVKIKPVRALERHDDVGYPPAYVRLTIPRHELLQLAEPDQWPDGSRIDRYRLRPRVCRADDPPKRVE